MVEAGEADETATTVKTGETVKRAEMPDTPPSYASR
jgi:hypothetical protein